MISGNVRSEKYNNVVYEWFQCLYNNVVYEWFQCLYNNVVYEWFQCLWWLELD